MTRPPDVTRPCPACGKEDAEFKPYRHGGTWYYRSHCHKCHRKRQNEYRSWKREYLKEKRETKKQTYSLCTECILLPMCRECVRVGEPVACEPGSRLLDVYEKFYSEVRPPAREWVIEDGNCGLSAFIGGE